MSYGLRRFLVLVGVFLMAFVVVFVIRRLQTEEEFFAFLKSEDPEQTFTSEDYTLPDSPPLNIDDVEILQRLDAEYAKLTAAVVPSVVSIDTVGIKKERLSDLFGRVWERRYETQGIGSGVIVTEEGHVITNQHVIADKSKIRVTLHDGKTYRAVLIGGDDDLDIAVLRIEGDAEFEPLIFGDSDRVQTGQMVFAVGNPFGLGETVTQGIISAKERSISERQRDLFQTDAAINPGNSGGPLVNLFGEIIAINVAIYKPDNQSRGSDGVGFSIPSNDVRDAFKQIVERGRLVRGYLGVQASLDLLPRVRKSIGYDGEKGAMVDAVVPGSPADKCGLQQFDIILSFDGKPVESTGQLLKEIPRTKVNTEVTLGVWRAGEEIELKVVIIDAVDAPGEARAEPETRSASDVEILNAIGIDAVDYTALERMRGSQGVLIKGVVTGSLAADRRLRTGDVVLAVNDITVNSVIEFQARLLASAAVQPTTVTIRRGQQISRVPFPRVPRSSGEGQ